MIDLNKEIKLVSKEGLKEYIQDIDVYHFYTNNQVDLTKSAISSPLREDKNPSFGYFYSPSSNEICFNDFVLGGGDFVKFVQLKFGINFFEALSKIVVDFNLQDKFLFKPITKTKRNDFKKLNYTDRESLLENSDVSKIGIKTREYLMKDLKYWMQYNIDHEILNKYRVKPIQYIFINGKPILADSFAYAFKEYKDNSFTYKIYQPFNKKYKWLTNHDSSVWQGWTQLPEKGEALIITKSLKDVMSIVNTTGIPAVSLQTESSKPKAVIIDELKSRFDIIYLLYDNDFDKEVNWGRSLSIELSNLFNLSRLEIPDKYQSKDFSDLIKNKGKKEANNILNDLIINYIPF
jgi:hypothetical protein